MKKKKLGRPKGSPRPIGAGRPKVIIDWEKFETLCAEQCSLMEIADYFNCAAITIERNVKGYYKCDFHQIFRKKRQKGLISLRQNLFKLSKTQSAVAIFLAKNWLGMSDKKNIDITAEGLPPLLKIVVPGKEIESREIPLLAAPSMEIVSEEVDAQ